jgi:hypothetical protein
MRPGCSAVERSFMFSSDVIHQALLEELPWLGIDVKYENCLHPAIDATAGVSAMVPGEHITVSIRHLDRPACVVRVHGYTRLSQVKPLAFEYPSNCTAIMEALSQRLCRGPPLDSLSYAEKLRARFGSARKKKPDRVWRLIRILFWCYVGYLLFR